MIKNLVSISMHIISCPECQRKLRIRAEHVGKKLHCTSCHHVFRPQAETLTPPSVPSGEPAAELQARLHRETSVRAVLEANHAAVVASLRQKEKDLEQLQGLVKTLQQRLGQAQQREQALTASQKELAAIRGQLDTARTELGGLVEEEQAALQARELLQARCQELESSLEQAARRHSELESKRQASERGARERLASLMEEFEIVREERDRLTREQVADFEARELLDTRCRELEAALEQASQDRTRLSALTQELEDLRSERARLLEEQREDVKAREFLHERCREFEKTFEQTAQERAEFDSKRQAFEACTKQLEQERAALQQELEFARQEIGVLHEAVKSLGFTPTYSQPETF